MAVVKMMVATLVMAAVAHALPPEEEALPAKVARQNQKEAENIRERRTGKFCRKSAHFCLTSVSFIHVQ